MPGRYRSYPQYKETVVSWQGGLPRHWQSKPLKYLCTFHGGGTPSKDVESFWNGDIPWVSPKDMKRKFIEASQDCITAEAVDSSSTKLVEEGALLLVVRSGILQHSIPVAINTRKMALNQDMKALLFGEKMLARFALYFVEGNQTALLLEWSKQGATVESLEHEYLANSIVPIPTMEEQIKIINFLDHETTKIDTLIEKQQRLIELLKEKRQAVISHAVTKGLNPDTPMKDSGVEWLGEVPEHWDVTYLNHAVDQQRKIMYGIVLPGPNVEVGVPIVKGGDVKPGRLTLDSLCKTTFEIESSYERSRLREGDLVYSIRGTIGDVQIVPKEIEGANLTQDAARIAPADGVINTWLYYVMESDQIFRQLEIGSLGAAVRGINIGDLKKARIPMPPESEQREIAEHLDLLVSKLARLEDKALEQVILLHERRTALISAAVTGKIDVRNWHPPQAEIPMEDCA